jgi:hypothetical protein
MPVIPATWEAKIGRMVVLGQPRQGVHKTPSQPIAESGDGVYLSSKLCKRLRLGWWFQASLGKKIL